MFAATDFYITVGSELTIIDPLSHEACTWLEDNRFLQENGITFVRSDDVDAIIQRIEAEGMIVRTNTVALERNHA